MSFSSHEYYILFFSHHTSRLNGLFPISDDQCLASLCWHHSRLHLFNDLHWILIPGIVGSQYNFITQTTSNRRHQRTLRFVTISSTAYDSNHLLSSRSKLCDGFQYIFQSVWCVCIVDDSDLF